MASCVDRNTIHRPKQPHRTLMGNRYNDKTTRARPVRTFIGETTLVLCRRKDLQPLRTSGK